MIKHKSYIRYAHTTHCCLHCFTINPVQYVSVLENYSLSVTKLKEEQIVFEFNNCENSSSGTMEIHGNILRTILMNDKLSKNLGNDVSMLFSFMRFVQMEILKLKRRVIFGTRSRNEIPRTWRPSPLKFQYETITTDRVSTEVQQ